MSLQFVSSSPVLEAVPPPAFFSSDFCLEDLNFFEDHLLSEQLRDLELMSIAHTGLDIDLGQHSLPDLSIVAGSAEVALIKDNSQILVDALNIALARLENSSDLTSDEEFILKRAALPGLVSGLKEVSTKQGGTEWIESLIDYASYYITTPEEESQDQE
mgnify:CR=1 FL=1